LALGAPFLLQFPWSYIKGSFDLGRKFFFIWSVNWKFVPEEIFLSDAFSVTLLMFHMFALLAFTRKWSKSEGGIVAAVSKTRRLTEEHIVTCLFQANFLGIFFARSLHFQFYVWYYHTLPYLLWRTSLPIWLRFD
jgi:alpha-1,3-mannosyltransferase